MSNANQRIGLWLVGACGSVGSTVALGLAALRRELTQTTGLVTEMPAMAGLPLPLIRDIEVGGHDIGTLTIEDAVESLHKRAGLFDERTISQCVPTLRTMQRSVRPGTTCGTPMTHHEEESQVQAIQDQSPAEAVSRLRADIAEFRQRHKLTTVVVINIASSEPPIRRTPTHKNFEKLSRESVKHDSAVLPPSSLYAWAAIEERCPYVNFTPSTGIGISALQQRATELGVPFMGNDGKTGETLVKSALAPMFAMRNLRVLSWVGQNILGNNDGAVLQDPKTRAGKLKSKDRTIAQVLGPNTLSKVSIDFVPSLDDWKVAWDFIHFEGFLGTKMNLQFSWQGSDSTLAAPLIIDLARFSALALHTGFAGPMHHLAFFFKDPIDVQDHDLASQWRALAEYATEVRSTSNKPAAPVCDR